jgi:hypothetical protein
VFQNKGKTTHRSEREQLGSYCRGERPPYSSMYIVQRCPVGPSSQRGINLATYRAFAHKTPLLSARTPSGLSLLSSHFSDLHASLGCSSLRLLIAPSAHIMGGTYRALTHIITVLSPMFLLLMWLALAAFATSSLQKLRSSYLLNSSAVLWPIFLPCFRPRSYRTLAHRAPVLRYMEYLGITVLSPTKRYSKCWITRTISILKDVLKTDIKNTSASLMMFFLFGVGQALSARRHSI